MLMIYYSSQSLDDRIDDVMDEIEKDYKNWAMKDEGIFFFTLLSSYTSLLYFAAITHQ